MLTKKTKVRENVVFKTVNLKNYLVISNVANTAQTSSAIFGENNQ